ncbi:MULTISPECIES: thioredoxin [Bacillaceae]|nr:MULTISPECIES: thioredoxin [Bacillaceae]MCM3032573.1 thioredoxin [Niallia sp. MER 6]PGT83484.1 thioredoxin [Bacillus sp. AFS040349]
MEKLNKKKSNSNRVVADFFATWCGPCKMIVQVLEELDQDMGNEDKVVKINVNQDQETANNFAVLNIPALLVMKDGEVVDTLVGYRPKEAQEEVLNKHI